MSQSNSSRTTSDWELILSIELSLGFKSDQNHLICHRQSESVFEQLFTKIASLYPEFKGLDAKQICESGGFQVECDKIFDELGQWMWEGPEASWLTKESEYGSYGKCTSVRLYWSIVDKEDLRGMRYYFHELVGLYLANAELTTGNTVSVRPFGGSAVELGESQTGSPVSGSNCTSSTTSGNSSSQAASVAASVKDSKRLRKKPQRYDEEDNKHQRQPAKAGRKRDLNGSFRPQREETEDSPSEQRTLVEGSASTSPRPLKYAAPRKSAPSLGSLEIERRFGIDADSLYRSTPRPQRTSSKSVSRETALLRSPASGTATATSGSTAPVPPSITSSVPPGDDALPGAEANEAAEDRPVTATADFDSALNDIDEDDEEREPPIKEESQFMPGHTFGDSIVLSDDEPEPPIKEESQSMPGSTLGNSIVLSDDEDDGFQRNNRQRSSKTGSQRPPSLSTLHIAGSSEPQSRNGGMFEGRRARVCWGPKAPFDDILTLTGCSDSAVFIQRVEAMKLKRYALRNDRIAAAGVKFDGGACFRILWEDADPAFEEMLEIVQGVRGGRKFDLKFEIEWEDEEEVKPVKMESR